MGKGKRGSTAVWAVIGTMAFSAAAAAVVACSDNSSTGSGNSVDASDDGTGIDSTLPGDDGSTPGPDGSDGGTKDSAPDSRADSTVGDASDGGAGGDSSDGAPSGGDASDAAADADSAAAPSCQVFDASGLDEAAVNAGFMQVWTVYKCYTCHQHTATQPVDDAGNGIVLSGNNAGLGDSGTTFPPNLTNDPSTGLGCWTNDQIQAAMLSGAEPEGGTLCPSMPKWGNAIGRPGTPMDAGTAQEIIAFLRSLPVVVNQVQDTTCVVPEAGSDAGDAGIADAADGG